MKRVKRTVEWESYSDGVLTGSGTYKNRTIYIDKDGGEWYNYTSQKRPLENGKIVYRATTIVSRSFDDIIQAAKNLNGQKSIVVHSLNAYMDSGEMPKDMSFLKDLDILYKRR